jgi:hypothetical protein
MPTIPIAIEKKSRKKKATGIYPYILHAKKGLEYSRIPPFLGCIPFSRLLFYHEGDRKDDHSHHCTEEKD